MIIIEEFVIMLLNIKANINNIKSNRLSFSCFYVENCGIIVDETKFASRHIMTDKLQPTYTS